MEMRVGGDVVEEFEYTPYLLYGPRNYFGEWECIFPRLRVGGVRAESICEVQSKPFLSVFLFCFGSTLNKNTQAHLTTIL